MGVEKQNNELGERSLFRVYTYHPKHDGMESQNSQLVSLGVPTTNSYGELTIINYLGEPWAIQGEEYANSEVFSVTRSIDMAFGSINENAATEWGTSRLGGEWNEVITELHSQPLQVKGAFVITHVSNAELEL